MTKALRSSSYDLCEVDKILLASFIGHPNGRQYISVRRPISNPSAGNGPTTRIGPPLIRVVSSVASSPQACFLFPLFHELEYLLKALGILEET
jgi:hypothetical protein